MVGLQHFESPASRTAKRVSSRALSRSSNRISRRASSRALRRASSRISSRDWSRISSRDLSLVPRRASSRDVSGRTPSDGTDTGRGREERRKRTVCDVWAAARAGRGRGGGGGPSRSHSACRLRTVGRPSGRRRQPLRHPLAQPQSRSPPPAPLAQEALQVRGDGKANFTKSDADSHRTAAFLQTNLGIG